MPIDIFISQLVFHSFGKRVFEHLCQYMKALMAVLLRLCDLYPK